MGQHHTATSGGGPLSRPGLRAGIAVALVVALAGGVYVLWDKTHGDCGERRPITVIAEGDLGEYVDALAELAENESCYDYSVEAVPASHVEDRLAGEKGADIWVAESPSRVRQVATALGRSWSDIGPSIGTSPIVVAGHQLPELPSWSKVLTMKALRVDPPAKSDVSNAAVIGALSEMASGSMTHSQLVETLTMRALRMNDADGAPDLEAMANSSDPSLALTTERTYAKFADSHPNAAIDAAVPDTGTVSLDYRIANVAQNRDEATADHAIVALVDVLKTDEGKAIRDAQDIRPADGAVLPDGRGVGQVDTITPPNRELIDNIGRKWRALTLPIRALVVQDVSGSMKETAGDKTRAELLREASVVGLSKFPKNTELGYWEFSVNRGSNGAPYREVVPIVPISGETDGTSNREILSSAIESSLSNVRGGTGLYDTALAAFKHVYDTYDPAFSNSVILMTDGRNETRDSITLKQLVSELNIMKNPARRIPIITVGISSDADADALKKISDATGGSSFVALDPNDIGTILLKAVSYRAAAA